MRGKGVLGVMDTSLVTLQWSSEAAEVRPGDGARGQWWFWESGGGASTAGAGGVEWMGGVSGLRQGHLAGWSLLPAAAPVAGHLRLKPRRHPGRVTAV